MDLVYRPRRVAQSLWFHGVLFQSILIIAGTACFVVLLEYWMLRVGFFNGNQAVWWPTNGLTLALSLRSHRRRWPMIFVGVVVGMSIGMVHYDSSIFSKAVNIVANTAGPFLAAILLPHFETLTQWIQEKRIVIRFTAFAILLAPFVSASIHAVCLHLGKGFERDLQFRGISNMLGYALFTPLVLVLSSRETYRLFEIHQLPKVILLLPVVAVVTFLVFAQTSYALSFVLTSVVLIITLHLGFAAAVLGVNVLAVIATSQTMHGHGPFALGAGSDIAVRIVLLQAFLTLSMIAVFAVSVTQIEREVFQTKLKIAYKEMEALAITDSLTGLTNRRQFEQSLDIEWARACRVGESIALLTIDADDFKFYNDSFGHPAGDDCLRAIADELRKMERRSTDLLARYGGEEFVLLLPASTLEAAAHLAENMRRNVERLYEQQTNSLQRKVTISIGCAAITPLPGMLPKMLIDASDQALYLAKNSGRNRVECAIIQNAMLDFDAEPNLTRTTS